MGSTYTRAFKNIVVFGLKNGGRLIHESTYTRENTVMLELSAIHQTSQAKNIPYQPLLIKSIIIKLFVSCLFQHAHGCPCRFLTATDIGSISNETKNQGVNVGVAVILQSSDQHVLLTRRAKHMRTFPGIWVPPGKFEFFPWFSYY